MTKPL